MKVIGILRTKDDADLLPEVLEHITIDEIYAYEDGSQDSTYDILKNCNKVVYLTDKSKHPTHTKEVHKTCHLEHMVKKNNPEYKKKEIWVSLLGGDYFFLTDTPKEAALKAQSRGYDLKQGIALNFCRHIYEDWDSVDTWPNWNESLRKLCRWVYIAETLPLVWKVADYTRYKRLPWPSGFKKRDVDIWANPLVIEHQGKRSPRYHQWKYLYGSRKVPNGYSIEYFNNIENVKKHAKRVGFFMNPHLVPWISRETLKEIEKVEGMKKYEKKIYFSAINFMVEMGIKLPPREDL